MIFDHTLFSAGPLYHKDSYHCWNPILKGYDWSDDNSAELAKGWIKRADTIPELAQNIGQDPATFEDTTNKWNEYCEAGEDLEFGRTMMLSPIKDAPFYAVELSPTFLNTQGGPRRNAKGQIVRPNGSPIPRLYSAGELGSIYSIATCTRAPATSENAWLLAEFQAGTLLQRSPGNRTQPGGVD